MDEIKENIATVSKRLRKLEDEYNELDKKLRSVGGYLSPQEMKRRNALEPILIELRAKQKKLVDIRKFFENKMY